MTSKPFPSCMSVSGRGSSLCSHGCSGLALAMRGGSKISLELHPGTRPGEALTNSSSPPLFRWKFLTVNLLMSSGWNKTKLFNKAYAFLPVMFGQCIMLLFSIQCFVYFRQSLEFRQSLIIPIWPQHIPVWIVEMCFVFVWQEFVWVTGRLIFNR